MLLHRPSAEGCRYDVTQRPSSFHTAIA